MADLQFIYREGYCDLYRCYREVKDCYSEQCHTSCAEDAGCRYYCDGKKEDEPYVIPFGDCIHAMFKTRYKGVSAKNYEIEEFEDDYNEHLNCALVTIGKHVYECEKVILNGEPVYPREDPTEKDMPVRINCMA